MPKNNLQPEMWTFESAASVIATGATAVLFVGFLIVCLFRHLGLHAMAFGGMGAVLMSLAALGQWRAMKQRAGKPPR